MLFNEPRFSRFCIVSLALFFVGCKAPCKELQENVCKELPSQSGLCTIVREEANREIPARRCRAVLASWETEGQKSIRGFSKRYQKYHDWLSRTHKMHKGLQRLTKEKRLFRGFIRKLLGHSPPPTRSIRSSAKKKRSLRRKIKKKRKRR